jgi:hypothetical protein
MPQALSNRSRAALALATFLSKWTNVGCATALSLSFACSGAWAKDGAGQSGAEQASGAAKAASPTTTAPAAAEDAALENLRVTIVAVQGMVQVRAAEDQPWKPAEVGAELSTGAEFRTGPRSAVSFKIPPDQTITLDRLGVIKVLQAVRASGKFKTDVGMRYGRTRYEIEAAGTEHEATIHSPAAILAVRGTHFGLYDQQPYPVRAYTDDNPVLYKSSGVSQSVLIGADGGGATIEGEQLGPAVFELLNTLVDPSIDRARGPAEQGIFVHIPEGFGSPTGGSFGGGGFRDQITQNAGPGPGVGFDPTFAAGSLVFDLRWNVDVDLDLSVVSAKGETLSTFPNSGGKSTVPSGGKISRDDTGSSVGGRETASWIGKLPIGNYQFSANYASGTLPATFTLQVRQQLSGQSTQVLDTLTGTLGGDGQTTAGGNVNAGGGGNARVVGKKK